MGPGPARLGRTAEADMEYLGTAAVLLAIYILISLYGRWRLYERARRTNGPEPM